MAKPSLKTENKTTKAVLARTLDHVLRLLNPFMPFITEEIWQHLPVHGKSLAVASFPLYEPGLRDARAEEEMLLLQNLVIEVRTIRAENKISPREKIEIWLKSPGEKEKRLIPEIRTYILTLANSAEVRLWDHFPAEKRLLKGVTGGWEVAIPLEGVFDLEAEKLRLEKEIKKVQAEMEKVEGRLQNNDFIERAPQSVIEEARQSLGQLRDKKSKLEKSLEHIKQ
jgi:valyl-tRNA synthetase